MSLLKERNKKMLRWIPRQSGYMSKFSTAHQLFNEKRVGLFLFGRPPEPNLQAGKQSIEERTESIDPLSKEILEKLHIASTPTDILDIYSKNKQFMTDIHISRALQQLSEVYEINPENLPILVSHQTALEATKPIFRELCVSCLREAQYMDDHTFVSSLRALLTIGVPENSVLVCTLLTQSQHRLNHMSPASLAVFCQVLSGLKVDSELSKALKKAVALIVPKMVVKADGLWQCVTFLQTTGNDIPLKDRIRLQHKMTALLKLDPSVTLQDCCKVVSALSSSYIQSRETVEAVYEHLHKLWKALTDIEVCILVKDMGKLRYQDQDLMRQLSDRVCHSFEELDTRSLSGLFNGLTNGRFYHHELANLGCNLILESASDKDLTVDISLLASIARYTSRLNINPVHLGSFCELCHKVCEELFTENGSLIREQRDALDAVYHACLLNNLKVPGERLWFEGKAKEYLQREGLSSVNVQKVHLQVATLRRMDAAFDVDDDQIWQSLQNPWQITQRHDNAMEIEMIHQLLQNSAVFGHCDMNVEFDGGLIADFVLEYCGNHSKSTNKGLAVNILPKEGHAVNKKGHLVGLYHLKDRAMKKFGYQTLWIEANRLSIHRAEGKKPRDGAFSYLKELLEQNDAISQN